MLSVGATASTRFVSAHLLRRSAAPLRREPSIIPSRFPQRSSTSIRMSSSDSNPNPNQIIEHVVLFRVKPDATPLAVAAMVTNLNGLKSLDSVLYISARAISRCRSSSLAFTHMLHARYRSKTDLTTYAKHPAHVSVVNNHVNPAIDDIMAVDWVADDFSGPAIVPPSSALRLTVLKLKEEENGKGEVLQVLRGIKDKFPSIEQLTVGENFSMERGKGFSIGSIAVFKGQKELEELDSETELANEQKDKVREFLDSVLVLDYLVDASV